MELCTSHSSVTGCRDEGMRGSEGQGGWKPPQLRSQGSASCAGGRCDLVWLQRQEVKEEEDNEGICGPGCSCSRQGGAWLTDKTIRRGETRSVKMSAKDEDGTSNRGLGPGCWETHSCLAQRRMGQWDRRKDGWHKQGGVGHTPLMQMFTSRYLLLLQAPALCVHIDVSLLLCMDLYLYETVILFPCRPCVQLSTAPTKTQWSLPHGAPSKQWWSCLSGQVLPKKKHPRGLNMSLSAEDKQQMKV